MTIRQSDIRSSYFYGAVRKSAQEARRASIPTAFLSHSHKDATLAKGVQAYLLKRGWDVYIDWEDAAMPDTPSRETADRIRAKIRDLDMFLFLATANSMASRWCPWELGYADGKKPNERILIMQTRDDGGTTHGNEYMQLYRHIDENSFGELTAIDPRGRSVILKGPVTP